MTLRRLMVLAGGLPPESLFMSEIEDRPAVSEVSAAVADIFQVLTGESWPRWERLKVQRQEAVFKALLEQERVEARAHNAIYLEAQRARS